MDRVPKPGEIFNHFKDKPYQIITVATHTETGELMVVYQALYGDFRTYVRSMEMFLSEVDRVKYPEVKQKYRFELRNMQNQESVLTDRKEVNLAVNLAEEKIEELTQSVITPEGTVNVILLKFLDAESYSRKLDVITSNVKHLTDRLINDMAVSLDCAVDEGPLDQRIQGLIYCLQAMCRFEDKRLR